MEKALADGYAMIAPGCSVPPATTTEILRMMVTAAEDGC